MNLKVVSLMVLSVSALAMNAEARSSRLACPAGSTEVMHCADRTQRGDSIIAIGFMNEALVCRKGANFALIFDAEQMPQPSPAVPAQVINAAGAVNYVYSADSTTTFTLSRIVGPSQVNGKFSITAGGVTASRSLICR